MGQEVFVGGLSGWVSEGIGVHWVGRVAGVGVVGVLFMGIMLLAGRVGIRWLFLDGFGWLGWFDWFGLLSGILPGYWVFCSCCKL